MDEYTEGLFVVAVYLFVAVAFTLPFLVGHVYFRVNKLISEIYKFLANAKEAEEETRKYHE